MIHCPFDSPDYLKGLSNIGCIDAHPERDIRVLRRRIPGTNLSDGVGPWPYRCITDDDDLDSLHSGFRHLVTLSVVTHPGWRPSGRPSANTEIRLLKQHFMYDPDRPAPRLSSRSHRRVMEASRRGEFSIASTPREKMRIVALYQALKHRRGLSEGLFDLPPSHFKSIARLPNGIFFKVRDSHNVGAMACGVIMDDRLQILHLVPTEYGLTWNASYLMMHELQSYARENGLRLLTGGMPKTGSSGLAAFKAKWANAFVPVYLLCITNDPDACCLLTEPEDRTHAYFPPYRATH